MEISLFHSFFMHKFFIFNNFFWINTLKIETIKIIPVSFKNSPDVVINNIISLKPFYASIKCLHNVYFYTRFIKKNKSFKIMFLVFRFSLNIKYLNTIIFDIIFFWKNYSLITNKIYKFFKNSSKLNHFLILNDTRRVLVKYTYFNFFHFDFNYLVTNSSLVFYFQNSLDFLLFVKFFKSLLFNDFIFNEKR